MKAIQTFTQPVSRRQLQHFLGLVNFYHRFIPNCTKILVPLHAMVSAKQKVAKTFLWSADASSAFIAIKEGLAKATLLSHRIPDAKLSIMADASDVALSAVLQQTVDQQWFPISFYYCKLSPAKCRYCTFN